MDLFSIFIDYNPQHHGNGTFLAPLVSNPKKILRTLALFSLICTLHFTPTSFRPIWAGHVARMPMSRAPRQLLTSWVAHSRPVGCPQMTWGRALGNALASKGISKDLRSGLPLRRSVTFRTGLTGLSVLFFFLSPPPEGGLDLVTNRQGAILHIPPRFAYAMANKGDI